MLKKCLMIVSALLFMGAASANAENIKADLQYSPMNIDMKVACNTATITAPVYKLNLEGNVYRGAKLGIHYEGTMGKGDGSFGNVADSVCVNANVTNVTYSNFEINAKLPLQGEQWAKDYSSSGTRENNFYLNLGYKWNTLKTEVGSPTFPKTSIFGEEGSGWGIGLGYDGYFSGRFGFNALVMYYPSMSASAGERLYYSTNFDTLVYRLGVKYDLAEHYSVTLGYEGENHSYKNGIHVNYDGVVFGLEGRW